MPCTTLRSDHRTKPQSASSSLMEEVSAKPTELVRIVAHNDRQSPAENYRRPSPSSRRRKGGAYPRPPSQNQQSPQRPTPPPPPFVPAPLPAPIIPQRLAPTGAQEKADGWRRAGFDQTALNWLEGAGLHRVVDGPPGRIHRHINADFPMDRPQCPPIRDRDMIRPQRGRCVSRFAW